MEKWKNNPFKTHFKMDDGAVAVFRLPERLKTLDSKPSCDCTENSGLPKKAWVHVCASQALKSHGALLVVLQVVQKLHVT